MIRIEWPTATAIFLVPHSKHSCRRPSPRQNESTWTAGPRAACCMATKAHAGRVAYEWHRDSALARAGCLNLAWGCS